MTKDADQLTEIYNLLCRSALNKEYYGRRLHKTQTLSDVLEILIAVGTTGSGVSGIAAFTIEPYGRWIWGFLASASALLAVAKPIIQISKRIERLTRLYVGHTDNYTNLLILVSRIRRHGGLNDEMMNLFETAEARFLELAKEDDPHPDRHLLQQCESMIRERHPPQSAWYPKASSEMLEHP
ncbi:MULTISPECIES: hypothetical protein [unclassified Bradyrhizobium]|uniref:hypothetical protein n=1 Tax=unclassified Bradyrhizobium TaxID=2631580 RepID=UPI0028E5CB53|nr:MULTISPECIES: hypothetical protein [unclassified Bradyrhizobium]